MVSCPNCYSRQAWAWWLVAPTASGQACAWWLVTPTASGQAIAWWLVSPTASGQAWAWWLATPTASGKAWWLVAPTARRVPEYPSSTAWIPAAYRCSLQRFIHGLEQGGVEQETL